MFEGLYLQMDSGMEGGDNPPIEPAPDTSEGAETPPVEEPTGETPPEEVPTEPVTPVTPVTPTAAPDLQMQQKLAWYEQNYNNLLEQQKVKDEQLRQFETSSMTEDEKARYEIEVGRKEVEQDRQQLAQVTYAQQLYQYYSQFVPPTVVTGASPSDWQHSVLSHLSGENQQLRAQLVKLQEAATPGPHAPKVTKGAPQGASPKRTVFDMTREERDQLAQRASEGLTDENSYLPVE